MKNKSKIDKRKIFIIKNLLEKYSGKKVIFKEFEDPTMPTTEIKEDVTMTADEIISDPTDVKKLGDKNIDVKVKDPNKTGYFEAKNIVKKRLKNLKEYGGVTTSPSIPIPENELLNKYKEGLKNIYTYTFKEPAGVFISNSRQNAVKGVKRFYNGSIQLISDTPILKDKENLSKLLKLLSHNVNFRTSLDEMINNNFSYGAFRLSK